MEVSWQVTGIRHDAYANAYRIPVEEDKAVGEQGYYLHPEVFGQPESKGISAAWKAVACPRRMSWRTRRTNRRSFIRNYHPERNIRFAARI